MCGIVGLVRLGDRALPEPVVVRRMAASIVHRGPDGAGFFADAHAALGAVRLAVVDVRGGHQPARGCHGGAVQVVYNGELYGHGALRARLADQGHAVADHCDTSLVPHLYEIRGDALVDEMHGMFAFALWDSARQRLLLARDRLGIKPLFYAVTRDFLVFASEAKALFASGLVTPRIRRDSLDDLFSLGYPCPPHTMFNDVVELRPGHTLVVEDGRVGVPQRYWRAPVPSRAATAPMSRAAAADALHAALTHAVGTHLAADVPVASSLSGGLDSSVIAALAREVSGTAPETFSLTFPRGADRAFDESSSSSLVNAALGAHGHAVPMDASAAALLPEMIWHTELPLLVPGAIGGLLLAERERAAGVKVALTGDGADELLGGYDVFRAARARRLFDAPPLSWLRAPLFDVAARVGGQPRGLMRAINKSGRERARLRETFFGVEPAWLDQWQLLDVERDALLSPGGHRARPFDVPPDGWRAFVRDDIRELDPLDAQIALELETRLPSWILVISDRSAMAHGVEARVPFLDDDVVRAALAVPAHLKMRGLTEKAVLKDVARGLVPDAIRRRRKQPFMTPVAPWFFDKPRPAFVEEALSHRALDDAGLFDPDVVRGGLLGGLTEAPRGGVDRFRLELVLMLVLGTQLLHQAFCGNKTPPSRFPQAAAALLQSTS